MQTGFVMVELSNHQAEELVMYQKYRIPIIEIIREGVFDIKGGRAIIDFEDTGSIGRIIKVIYSKRNKLSTVNYEDLPIDN